MLSSLNKGSENLNKTEMHKIIVLGAGLIGGPIARDLASENENDVCVADINSEKLKKLKGYPITLKQADLSEQNVLSGLIQDFDIVVSCVPGFMGYNTLKTIIETGKDVVDIAFFPEDAFKLDKLAKKCNVTAIVDMGVAPGMSHLLSGYAYHQLDETHDIRIYVGGLPKVKEWPWEYKAVFSPVDVIEEYVRPARFVKNGQLIEMPALTDAELLPFPRIGTLEAFNSDGLRSLIKTLNVPNMIEKTLRYEGHIEKIKVLKDSGFFKTEAINVGGKEIVPLDYTSTLLFDQWKLKEGEVDITVMKVIVEGIKDDKLAKYTWDLYDEYDPETKVHSMARTTGYAATMATRMMLKGMFDSKGIIVPEFIGEKEECVEFILEGLAQRGVIYKHT